MKRYSQDQFGDMKERPTGKYILYNQIDVSNINILEGLKSLVDEGRSLVDGCYNVVELFTPKSPAQVEWRQNWLKKARLFIGD